MKINLKKTFLSLAGETMTIFEEGKNTKIALTLGAVLANLVLTPHPNKKGFRPLRALELARKFYDKNECEIEQSELIQIKELVENNENLMPLIAGQILEYLNEVK